MLGNQRTERHSDVRRRVGVCSVTVVAAAFLHLGSLERIGHVISAPTPAEVGWVTFAVGMQVAGLVVAWWADSALSGALTGLALSFASAFMIFLLGGGV